jgi:hypothetical protein
MEFDFANDGTVVKRSEWVRDFSQREDFSLTYKELATGIHA